MGKHGTVATRPRAAGRQEDLDVVVDVEGVSHASTSPLSACVAVGLVLVCLLAVWLAGFGFVFSRLQEQRSQSVLYAQLREQLSQATAPLGGVIPSGAPVAVLTAAGAGLQSVVVVEGTTAHDLTKGPGHLAGSPLPGQAGVSVVFGRSVAYGAPFAGAPSLRRGDPLVVTTGQGTFHYRVERVRYPGDPLPTLLPAGAGRMTLVTAAGSGWRAGWAPQSTVYVDADLVGAPASASTASAVVRSKQEAPMQGDASQLVALVLWLQGGLLLLAGGVWAAGRWGRVPTGVIGAPLTVAVLWGIGDSALQLLPNLL